MLDEQLIDELKCALSDEEHFFIKPITLSCGHSACKNCIPDQSNEKGAQHALNLCIGDIFQSLEKETTDRLKELKGIYLNGYSFGFYSSLTPQIKLNLKMKF